MKIKKPLLGLLVCASALLSANKAYATTVSVAEDVNLRSEPDTASSIVGTLSTGEQVEVIGTSGNWVEVSAQDQHGFVFHTFLNSTSTGTQTISTAQAVTNGQFATIVNPVYMRSAADSNSQIVKTLESGVQVEVLSSEGNWFKISVDNLQGYVYCSFLTFNSNAAESESVSTQPMESTTMTASVVPTISGSDNMDSESEVADDNVEDEASESSAVRSDTKATSGFTVYASTGINVRSKPSTSSSKIGSLSKGSAVRATALNNGWYTIIYNGRTGYISAQYSSKTKPISTYSSDPPTTTVYTTTSLNVRSQPSTTSSKLGVLTKGTAVSVRSSANGWFLISYNGKSAYINATYTTSTRPAAVTMYTTVGLSVRSQPSTSAQRLGVLPQGTAVKVTSLQNNWYTITYNGKTGYVSAQYVTSQKPSTATPVANTSSFSVYTTARLNVRSQPSTTSSKLGVLNEGVAVSVRNSSNGWYAISYNGNTGYISSQYTSKTRPGSTSSSGTASINDAIAIARQHIGYPYVWGGNGPSAYDCSGFTKMLYAKMGKTIPRTSYDQYASCKKVSKSNLKPGDLVFFSTSTPISNTVSHVGFYIGNGYMIHAANSKQGIVSDNINSNYYSQRYLGAGRY